MKRELPNVEFAFIKDVAVISKVNTGKFCRVEDADELFQLGVENVKYNAFYPDML